jgi:hypothetical protein
MRGNPTPESEWAKFDRQHDRIVERIDRAIPKGAPPPSKDWVVVKACFVRRRIFRLFKEPTRQLCLLDQLHREGPRQVPVLGFSHGNEWLPHNLVLAKTSAVRLPQLIRDPPWDSPEAAARRQHTLELVRRYKAGDAAAGEEIIWTHLYVVRQVESKFERDPDDRDDRIHAGEFGLRKALKYFDPERRVPFEAFARIPVRQAIQKHIYKKKAYDWQHVRLDELVGPPTGGNFYDGIVREEPQSLSAGDDPGPVTVSDTLVDDPAERDDSLEHWRYADDSVLVSKNNLDNHIIQERLAGKTNAEIGAEIGQSRQYVEYRIKKLRPKTSTIPHNSK